MRPRRRRWPNCVGATWRLLLSGRFRLGKVWAAGWRAVRVRAAGGRIAGAWVVGTRVPGRRLLVRRLVRLLLWETSCAKAVPAWFVPYGSGSFLWEGGVFSKKRFGKGNGFPRCAFEARVMGLYLISLPLCTVRLGGGGRAGFAALYRLLSGRRKATAAWELLPGWRKAGCSLGLFAGGWWLPCARAKFPLRSGLLAARFFVLYSIYLAQSRHDLLRCGCDVSRTGAHGCDAAKGGPYGKESECECE